MEYISLGSDCSVAYQLQKLGVRKCAYPFDWIRAPNINNITNIINSSFDGYVTSVTKINESSKFQLIDDNFNCEANSNNNNNTIVMRNKYGIIFYHDFGIDYDIDNISKKYDRRTNRFIELIMSDKKLCFIRYEKKYNNVKHEEILYFIDTIKKINQNAKIYVIIIVHNPKNKCISVESNNSEHIYVFNDTNHFDCWMRNNIDWQTIIKI